MQVFPYILVRLGGLHFDYIAELGLSERLKLDNILSEKLNLERQKHLLLGELELLIQKIEDYPAKFYLKVIRRDIFNNRKIKLKNFSYTGKFQDNFKKLIEEVRAYKLSLEAFEKLKEAFESFYNAELLRCRTFLQSMELPAALTKGLQLASSSLLQRIEQYRLKRGERINKKIIQTEHKLLQFLTRICAKTSPFSSFTTLALISLEHKIKNQNKRRVSINNSVFRLFKDILIHYPPFFADFPIRLNTSILRQEDSWRFLLNTRNIESVQRMEASGIIDLIIEILQEDTNTQSFNQLINSLLEAVDADAEALSSYLLTLIDYGLIEWAWPFSGLDPDWFSKLVALLEHYQDPLLVELKEALEELLNCKNVFAKGELSERAKSQQSAYELLEILHRKLIEETRLEEKVRVNTKTDLQHIISTGLNIKKEQLFYEDVSADFSPDFSGIPVEAMLREADALINHLGDYYFDVPREKLLTFFKNNYDEGLSVDLVSFYEDYFKNPIMELPSGASQMSEKRKNYAVEMRKAGDWLNDEEFHLPIELFSDKPTNKNIHPSKSSLIQLCRIDDREKVFMDTAIMGYGKMFGRFLSLFPDELTVSIKKKNRSIRQREEVWVENVDASIFNPNIHPALLDYEINMPGSQNNLPEEQQISVTDLYIRLDPKEDRLLLFHKKENKIVRIFDFGFEALDNRSPLYRILATFRYDLVGMDLLSGILENSLEKELAPEVIFQPRISVGDYLIIRRKSWKIAIEALPFKQPNETEMEFFLKINFWRKQFNMPAKVFIVIDAYEYAESIPKAKTDNYKPQFIDFESILLVQLFSKLIKKVPKFLKIEEMLPDLNRGDIVQEYLVEWET